MLYAAIHQKFIHKWSPCHDNRPSECASVDGSPNPAPINVWVISGPYIPVGVTETFTRHPVGVHFHQGSQANEVIRHGLLSVPVGLRYRPRLRPRLGRRRAQVHLALWFLRRLCRGYQDLSRLTFFKLSGAEAALNTADTGDRDGLADVHKPEGAHV